MSLGPIRRALSTILIGREATLTLEQFDRLMDASATVLSGGGAPSSTGLAVTADSALGVPTAWACVDLIASVVGSLPCKVYQRQDNGYGAEAPELPLYGLIHGQPNSRQTAVEFFSTGQLHLLTRGNFYAQIVRARSGQVLQLITLDPDKMTVGLEMTGGPRPRETGRLIYTYQRTSTDKVPLTESDVLHVRGLGFDGVVGYSPVALSREAFALALKAQDFGGAFLKNYARIPVFLKSPKKWTPEQKAQYASDWKKLYAGSNAGSTVILDDGMEATSIGFSPEDAQYLELRQFQRNEICAIFHVPPHMVGDVSGSTSWGTGIEQQFLGWLNTCIVPWLVRWTQRLDAALLGAGDRKAGIYSEFVTAGILRGDITTRYGAHRTAITTGWMNRNEVRRIENLPPVDGLDDYMSPANMTNAGSQSDRTPGDIQTR